MKKIVIVKGIVSMLVALSMVVPQSVRAAEKEDPKMNEVSHWLTYFDAEDGQKWDLKDGIETFRISDYQTEKEISERIYLGIVLKAGSINSNGTSAHEPHGDPGILEIFSFSNGKDLSHVILVWKDKPIIPPVDPPTPPVDPPVIIEPPVDPPIIVDPPIDEEPIFVEPTDKILPRTGSSDPFSLVFLGSTLSGLGVHILLKRKK